MDQETVHIRSATTAGAATRVISRKSSLRDSKRSWLEDPEIQRRHPVDGNLLDIDCSYFLFFHSCDLQAPGTWIEETLGSIKLTEWDLHVALGACLAGLAYLYFSDLIYPYFEPARDNLCEKTKAHIQNDRIRLGQTPDRGTPFRHDEAHPRETGLTKRYSGAFGCE